MPGAPDLDSVKLRSQPGRQLSADRNRFGDHQPAVPQPMGSSKLRRSTRFSAASLNSGSQFHSVISNISIRTDDIGPNNRVSVDSSATLVSDASFMQEKEKMFSAISYKSDDDDVDDGIKTQQEKGEKKEKGAGGDYDLVPVPRLAADQDYDLVPVPRLAADQDFLRVERERKEQSRTPVSEKSETENLMSETREDLLQGIRAMDDSIQTLKAEMSKLMSVYEHVICYSL
ncbi:uncharacterized protein LOC111708069 [Eurytemora carolleeae]|uniref:uncharacterized protein LOC111708069 n=1 Tax=Eurytemora carolleeae TaxID=1294199 RepID=UPI000C7814EE|nr:uncharacterized protein LOC111708069 [Eurytemora carolleeae]|eukprot:XP_023337088.1 uncharacterized protein LOC111708069 [Eurytemora affinis]